MQACSILQPEHTVPTYNVLFAGTVPTYNHFDKINKSIIQWSVFQTFKYCSIQVTSLPQWECTCYKAKRMQEDLQAMNIKKNCSPPETYDIYLLRYHFKVYLLKKKIKNVQQISTNWIKTVKIPTRELIEECASGSMLSITSIFLHDDRPPFHNFRIVEYRP